MESSISPERLGNVAGRRTITTGHIRACLAGTRLPDDPTCIAAATGSSDWRRQLVEKAGSGLRAAAILMPIIERSSGLSVLLTERAAELRHHPGQISFPGGRMESGDADLRHTALRETEEEVGILAHQVDIAGYLDVLPTITGYAVTPVVGLVVPDITLRIDVSEVAQVFEVPLEFLMDESNQQHSVRRFQGIDLPLVEYRYGPHRIWGATAAMLTILKDIIK
ncbi:MAG: CoA pyrophosphatase [Woeseia sp.]